jgi:acyl-CoA synthetase (AMP-forming)/AMP-acid ligase II
MDRWDAATGVALIENEHISISMGATPFLQELVGEAEKTHAKLPSLRIYVCGGAAVPPALIRKANTILSNCQAFRVFGSSEVPLTTLGFIKPEQADLAAETDGEVVHYEVRIIGENEQVLGLFEDGEICVRGPAMFLGYADALQTAESFDAEGYFKTGDIGHLTAENAITITGRKKDLINRGGEKISAKEIEDILHRNPAIEEAAVIAIPHARLGETVGVYVILKEGQRLNLEDLTDHMRSSDVAKQKYPERLEIVDSFPRTASGKIRKDLLRLHARTTE